MHKQQKHSETEKGCRSPPLTTMDSICQFIPQGALSAALSVPIPLPYSHQLMAESVNRPLP
jgi:hypothetical protein